MTEQEYIIITNRVKVSTAKRLIGECSVGDGLGMSVGQQRKLADILHTIEARLFKKIEEIMDG
jgi:hypothetical protein